MAQMIQKLGCELEEDNLIVLNVKGLSLDERKQQIVDCINDTKPDLVIIDGIRDLVCDFNDVKETTMLINQFMEILTNNHCGIIAVIHLNKQDKNMRGHLGTELMNKSESIIEIEKLKSNRISVKPKCCRGIEFEQFEFEIDNDGFPFIIDNNPKNER